MINKFVVAVVRADRNPIVEESGHSVGVADGEVVAVEDGIVEFYNAMSATNLYASEADILEVSDDPIEYQVGLPEIL